MESRHLLSNSPEISDDSDFEVTGSKQKLDLRSLADFFASQPLVSSYIPSHSRREVTRFPSSHFTTKPRRFISTQCTFFCADKGVLRAESLNQLDFGRFFGPSTEGSSMLEQQFDPSLLSGLLKRAPFWLDICDPSITDMETLSRLTHLHPLTTEDIQNQDTREKCELFPSYYFICVRTFDQEQSSVNYLQPIFVYLVVFQECLLTFHYTPIPHIDNVLRRLDHSKSFGTKITTDWMGYALIDDITDSFQPVLKYIEFEVDAIDDLVLILKESEQADMLRRIGNARKQVLLLLRLLNTKADMIRTIIKKCGKRMNARGETALYFTDIQDHAITMVQNLSHFEKILARAHSNYLAQISIEITQASNRTNDVVMRMTLLASILIPLNVITGLWGMNVHVPGQGEEGLQWFYSIVAFMIVFAVVTLVTIYRLRLI